MRQVILNLHGLGDPGRTLKDPSEARYWVTEDIFETALSLSDQFSDRVRTEFTFDDGNRSDLTVGAELLDRFGHRATFFVLAGRIGEAEYLSAEDIRQLYERGHRIGCHGADHVDWTKQDAASLNHEIVAARQVLADILGAPITTAALPLGRYNARVLRALRAAGYDTVYSSDGGAVHTKRWPVPRTSLTRDMTETHIADILLGHEPLRRRLRRVLARSVKTRI